MTPTILLRLLIFGGLTATPACLVGAERIDMIAAMGPLRVHPSNPRYFIDDSGKAVYLTGSHTWNNLVDQGPSDPPHVFDYAAFVDFLQAHNHNFMRMWRSEFTKFHPRNELFTKYTHPHPWVRVGPEHGLDGKPKFNLNGFDPAYFDRLRSRVIAARDRGIYVAIMLFEGWVLQNDSLAFIGHPFHKDNNINGINGDPDGDGMGREMQTLQDPAITALQETYVRKVIDTVNDLDNVLYEIANESVPGSDPWQNHIVDFIHSYEATKPRQHPVLYTAAWEYDGSELWRSRAEAISPGHPAAGITVVPYRDDPPANDGRKVIINDTDHLWGIGGNQGWVWKSFVRGLNPIFMDPYDGSVWNTSIMLSSRHAKPTLPIWRRFKEAFKDLHRYSLRAIRGHTAEPTRWKESIRRNMGYTHIYANKMDLAAMSPHNDLASTKYCLANPGKEYLVYLPSGGTVEVDVSSATVALSIEWFNPTTGATTDGGNTDGGAIRSFTSPFRGDAVLYLVASTTSQ